MSPVNVKSVPIFWNFTVENVRIDKQWFDLYFMKSKFNMAVILREKVHANANFILTWKNNNS